MALSSTTGTRNNDSSTQVVTPNKLGITTNYAMTTEEPGSVVYTNTTCPIDQAELLSFKYQPVKKVSTSQEVRNPASVQSGVQYVLKVEQVLRTTSTTDSSFVVDEPLVAYLTIRHPKSGNVTDGHIYALVKRVLGMLIKEDGGTRLPELMRGALQVKED